MVEYIVMNVQVVQIAVMTGQYLFLAMGAGMVVHAMCTLFRRK